MESKEAYNYGLKLLNYIIGKWKEQTKTQNDAVILYPFEYNYMFYFPIFEKIDGKFKLVEFKKMDILTLQFTKKYVTEEDIDISESLLDNTSYVNKQVIANFGNTYLEIKKILADNSGNPRPIIMQYGFEFNKLVDKTLQKTMVNIFALDPENKSSLFDDSENVVETVVEDVLEDEEELVEDDIVEEEIKEDVSDNEELVEDELVEDELVEDELVEDEELIEEDEEKEDIIEDEIIEEEIIEEDEEVPPVLEDENEEVFEEEENKEELVEDKEELVEDEIIEVEVIKEDIVEEEKKEDLLDINIEVNRSVTKDYVDVETKEEKISIDDMGFGDEEVLEDVSDDIMENIAPSETNNADVNEEDPYEEAKDIINKMDALEDKLNKLEINISWEPKDGLKFVSKKVLDLAVKLLEIGSFTITKDVNEENKFFYKFTSNIGPLCKKNITEEDVYKKIEDESIYDKGNVFKIFNLNAYDTYVCPGCKFQKCPKYYASYLYYLQNKGMLEEKLMERADYRKNILKSDYFNFEWKNPDGLKKVPEETFNYAMELVKKENVFVSAELNEKGNMTIYSKFPCSSIKNSGLDYSLIEENTSHEFPYNVTRDPNKFLYTCNKWVCRVVGCVLYDVAGYIFYLKKKGLENQILEDREYYKAHKEEIDIENEKIKEDKLKSFDEKINEKNKEVLSKLAEFKDRITNIDEIIDRLKTEKNLHFTLEGDRGTGKFKFIDLVTKFLYDSEKITKSKATYISMHNLAWNYSTEMKLTTPEKFEYWTLLDRNIEPNTVYVVNQIGEFIKNYKLDIVTKSAQNYFKQRKNNYLFETLTSLFKENYIFLVGDEEEINELFELDSRFKFVYQNNRILFQNLKVNEMFELYCTYLEDNLLFKIRDDKEYKEEVRVKFVDYLGKNAEFFPFYNEELARYLANYSNSKQDAVFPLDMYKKETVEEALNSIIGMQTVKDKVKEFEQYVLYTVKAKNLGLNAIKSNLHMVFTGNPGTGKTTIARIMAKMLYDLGLIKENKLVEVERKDLVAAYIGQTAMKTTEIIDKALGGVLFVDEAYTLSSKSANDFGGEAVATLIKAMEDRKDELVVIFAGYRDEMKSFLDTNPGIESRIGYTFDFPDYNADELVSIFDKKLTNDGYEVSSEVKEKVKTICNFFVEKKNFGNGRFIDKLIQATIMKHALNSDEKIEKIYVKDIPSIEELNNAPKTNGKAAKLLEELVGMNDLKDKIKEFEQYVKFIKTAENQQITIPSQNMHMIFTGNPGTGKTTVARIIAELLFDLGIIHENKVIEVERKDLIASYVGQTAPKTAEVIERAMGGVLFVDEAYTLSSSNSSNDFGGEAIATLIKAMEDHKGQFVCIFAGYKKEMGDFLNINPGIASRIGYIFEFPDYEAEEFCEIYYRKLNKIGFKIEEDAKENVLKLMRYFANMENIGNGRFVDKVIQATFLKMSKELKDDVSVITSDVIPTIDEMSKTLYDGNNMIKPDTITEEDIRKTAIHETGHALMRYLLMNEVNIKKITINAEGAGTLGYVEYNKGSGKYVLSKQEMLDQICVLLAGMGNEQVFIGYFKNGNGSDLEKCARIAESMIAYHGMSDLGLYAFGKRSEFQDRIFDEANKILDECYKRTIKLLEDNKGLSEKVIDYLLEHKEITGEEFSNIVEKTKKKSKKESEE